MNRITLAVLTALAGTMGVTANPFDKKGLGIITATELGPRLTGTNGKQYFQAGEYRIAVKSEVPEKAEYSVFALVAKVDFKSMKAGQAFLIAE